MTEDLWGLKIDWGAIATLVTGVAAVGAAFWTVKRTEQSARNEAAQRTRAAATRAVAVLEVARERIQSFRKKDRDASDILPWNAFSALSADIGLLGIDPTRLFIFIERLAREAEHFAKNNDGRPSEDQINNLLDSIDRLLKATEELIGWGLSVPASAVVSGNAKLPGSARKGRDPVAEPQFA